MSRVLSVHSFRGGTGKSNTTANVAALGAARGLRIAVVDLDIQSPGIHVLFGFEQAKAERTLNDYLWSRAGIVDTAYDVTPGGLPGKVFLVPSSIDAVDIARMMQDGYDVGLLNDGFRELLRELSLDALLLDTHPGLNEETLLSIAVSDALAIVMRPDQQDYEGTHVTVSVARKLRVPRMVIVVNKTPSVFDAGEVKERVERAYECEVAAVLPHSDELMALSSGGIFSLREPDHPVTALYRQLTETLLGE